MSVTGISPASVNHLAAPTPKATNARAADGDYKTPGIGRVRTKDADGDYKPTASAATRSASAVQAALSLLTKGG